MDAILQELVRQLPIVAVFLVAGWYGLNQFFKFIEKRDLQWQDFLDKQQAQSDKRLEDRDEQMTALVRAIKELNDTVQTHDQRVTQGMAIMQERTRPRTKGD